MKSRARWFAVAVGVAAAAVLAVSVEAGVWWSVGEVTIGPFGSHHCFTGNCRATGLAWIGGSDLWMRGAIATGFAGLLSSLLLVIIAGAAAAGRAARLAARMTLVSLATAAVTGAYFFAAFPGLQGVHVDRGVPLFVIGLAGGVAAAISVLRWGRPAR